MRIRGHATPRAAIERMLSIALDGEWEDSSAAAAFTFEAIPAGLLPPKEVMSVGAERSPRNCLAIKTAVAFCISPRTLFAGFAPDPSRWRDDDASNRAWQDILMSVAVAGHSGGFSARNSP